MGTPGHPDGCRCDACKRGPLSWTVTAYAVSFPACPPEPVYVYACPCPREPFVPSPPPGTTITWPPESPELAEIRKLREDVAKLARTQEGMAKLVERFLKKAKK